MPADHDATIQLLDYADRYREAAAYIPEVGNLIFPFIQIYGHTIELSLKAYLAATRGDWNNIHNLVELACEAESLGLEFTEKQAREILPHFQKWYYRLETKEHLTRYPRREPGLMAVITPQRANLSELIDSVCKQARRRLAGE